MSKQLARSFEGDKESRPSSVQIRGGGDLRVQRWMRAIVLVANIKAAETDSDLHVVLAQERGERRAPDVAFVRFDRCREEDVIHNKQLGPERGLDGVRRGLPKKAVDLDVVLEIHADRQKIRQHQPVHSGLREKDITSLTSDSNRRKAA